MGCQAYHSYGTLERAATATTRVMSAASALSTKVSVFQW
jgi:hypothetical protein